jgi:hypothetical protein
MPIFHSRDDRSSATVHARTDAPHSIDLHCIDLHCIGLDALHCTNLDFLVLQAFGSRSRVLEATITPANLT